MKPLRNLGDVGQCEAHDLISTEDDAVDVRCHRQGRVIRERMTDLGGGPRSRLRCVCPLHGLSTAMEVN